MTITELNENLKVVKCLDDSRNMAVNKISGDGWKCKAVMVYDSGNVSIYVDDLDALVKDLGFDSRIVSLNHGRFTRYKNINFTQAYVDSDLVAV
ncbi:hypothetical protein [Eubacterium sp.]|uniref:hypothetical protein n=1 Tax=Eubacterium sp. TaxID=142586 RepID=UPI002FC90129